MKEKLCDFWIAQLFLFQGMGSNSADAFVVIAASS